jgi:hypothetical protein
VAEAFIPVIPDNPAASSEDVSLLRDPFANFVMPVASNSADKIPVSPSGLRLQGVILSKKNGVVLEDVQSRAVLFLSEGEQANGILVKSITKTSASVEVGGNLFNVAITGEKK